MKGRGVITSSIGTVAIGLVVLELGSRVFEPKESSSFKLTTTLEDAVLALALRQLRIFQMPQDPCGCYDVVQKEKASV